MAIKAKEFRFAVDLQEGGALRSEDGTKLETDLAFSPEHLLLAALVRCSLTSLRFHARRAKIEVSDEHGSVRSLFTMRESDNRYAAVDIEVDLSVRLSPKPSDDALAKLLERAEHDCFVGASLTAKPIYNWTVS